MPLTCNIDARGKRTRLFVGVILVLVGLALLVGWGWRGGSVLGWVLSLLALAGGAFSMFEARAGWCAIRAMGWKTPV